MSLPNIPDISPDIDICKGQAINLLLSSIAMEELALSHLINVEAEKAQSVLKTNPPLPVMDEVTDSEDRALKSVIIKEILLLSKFEHVLDILDKKAPPSVHKNKATATGDADGQTYKDTDYAHYWRGIKYQ